MKNLFLVSALFMTTPAHAGVSWVQTPFWQTAYATNYSVDLENRNKELAAECRRFERYVYDDRGVMQISNPSQFQILNLMSLPGDMDHASFHLEMKLALPPSMALQDPSNSELRILTDQRAKTDFVPHFTQNPALVVLQPESLQSPLQVEKQKTGLMTAAEKLKAPTGAMKFVRRTDGYYLAFSSKDAACDMLGRRATIALDVKVGIKITLEKQIVIQNFYADIEKIALATTEKHKTSRARAAALGFQLGAHLAQNQSPQNQLNDVAEFQMLELLTRFFEIESMSPNKNWSEAFGRKVLSVSGTAPDQNATLQINGPLQ